MTAFRTVHHDVDVCIIGGGMTGVCASIAAARRGAKTLIMHDRPVFGGNASSEIRMHIIGAQERFTRGEGWNWKELRETGIIEELRLSNQRHNPQMSWHVWDGVMYDKIRVQPNLSYLLNCSCLDAEMDVKRIVSVKGWQSISQTYHVVRASIFIDCSGDSVLAPLSGAEFRYGREGRDEFNESLAPELPDEKTMGMSCMYSAVDTGEPHEFIPFEWAKKLADEDLPFRNHSFITWGFAWIELGGEQDMIHDTDDVRDELMTYVYGVWDHIKNHDDHGAAHWALDWIQFLPGKRESRRLMGDTILTQNDIDQQTRFPDVVAYGGWCMDAHEVKGIKHQGPHTQYHYTPAPYGIPYRCLYSRNIDNLMFAGRNISASHMALTSTRVQGTCSIIGQAVGTAAALAIRCGCSPRQVGQFRVHELQQNLLEDNCYLPGVAMQMPALTRAATLTASEGDPEPLRNGVDRPVGDEENAWWGRVGSWVALEWAEPVHVNSLRVVCDSDLNCIIRMNVWEPPIKGLPPTMVRDLAVEVRREGQWEPLATVADNERRLIRIDLDVKTDGLRLRIEKTWGEERIRLFAVTVH
jgi:hypothetical protein